MSDVLSVLDFKKIKDIASGTFGKVWQGQRETTNEIAAVKQISTPTWDDLEDARREVDVLKRLSHPNIIRFFGSMESPSNLFIVMEHVEKTLKEHISAKVSRQGGLPHLECRLIMYQVLKALNYIHKRRITHRDLKPSNILINSSLQIKLADFGSAKRSTRRVGVDNTTHICTFAYRAPELILGSTTYGTEIDLWSAGCVLIDLVTGSRLFPEPDTAGVMDEMFFRFSKPIPANWPGCQHFPKYDSVPPYEGVTFFEMFGEFYENPLLINFLTRLLTINPNERITAGAALHHPFFYRNLTLVNGGPEVPCGNGRKHRHHTYECSFPHKSSQLFTVFDCTHFLI